MAVHAEALGLDAVASWHFVTAPVAALAWGRGIATVATGSAG